jgi:long-chain fatty acid transport protein
MEQVFARPKLLAASIASVFLAAAGQAQASGFQLQEQSASGLGVAYSGMAAAVQDASTSFWNPAGMTYLPGRNVSAALHYIRPSADFTDGGSTYAAFGNGGSGGESAFVPALHATWMLNPQWAVGLTINAPFGLATEWDQRWAGQFHAIKSEVETLNINPTVAYKVNNMFSVGLGFSYQKLEATLTNALSPLVPGSVGEVHGDDWNWGWNAGVMIDFQQGTRVGLTYRSSIEYTIEGDLSIDPAALRAGQSNVKADVELPATWSIGLSHQFNPKLRVLVDYTRTEWDSIQSLDIVRTSGPLNGQIASATALNFKNSWRAGIGVEYQLSQPWLLRAGLAYDETPVQDEFRTPRLPDENRTWFSVGARYMPAAAWSIDFGYTYINVSDASSNLRPTGAEAFRGNLIGNYEADIHILAVQGNFRF